MNVIEKGFLFFGLLIFLEVRWELHLKIIDGLIEKKENHVKMCSNVLNNHVQMFFIFKTDDYDAG